MKAVKIELEIGFGLKYRHDLKDEAGGCMRSWKGLAMVKVAEAGIVENAFVESG